MKIVGHKYARLCYITAIVNELIMEFLFIISMEQMKSAFSCLIYAKVGTTSHNILLNVYSISPVIVCCEHFFTFMLTWCARRTEPQTNMCHDQIIWELSDIKEFRQKFKN